MKKNSFNTQVSKLIQDIENDSFKLSTLLVRAKSIAKRANLKDLENLIKHELEGNYDTDLPGYRKRSGTPYGVYQNSFTGQVDNMPLNMEKMLEQLECEPDFFYKLDLRYSIPEIEDYMEKSKTDELIIKFTPNQLGLMKKCSIESGNWFLKDGYYQLSLTTFPDILANVKNILLDYLLDLDDKLEIAGGQKIEVNLNHQIFFKGTHFDALIAFLDIVKQAQNNIILIDNFIDQNTIKIFSDIPKEIVVLLITQPKSITPSFDIILESFKKQYRDINIKQTSEFHDRFLIIDNKDFYSIGASIKDAGKKVFMYTKISDSKIHNMIRDLLQKI